jgi:hypothetical protein
MASAQNSRLRLLGNSLDKLSVPLLLLGSLALATGGLSVIPKLIDLNIQTKTIPLSFCIPTYGLERKSSVSQERWEILVGQISVDRRVATS